MTISAYIEDLKKCKLQPGKPEMPSFMDAMLDSVDIWSNAAAQGYALKAAQRMGMDEAHVKELLHQMRLAFDDLTVDEAAQISNSSTF